MANLRLGVLDWVVSLERAKPFSSQILATFPNEQDALDYVTKYAVGKTCERTSRRRWTFPQTGGANDFMVVWKREG